MVLCSYGRKPIIEAMASIVKAGKVFINFYCPGPCQFYPKIPEDPTRNESNIQSCLKSLNLGLDPKIHRLVTRNPSQNPPENLYILYL